MKFRHLPKRTPITRETVARDVFHEFGPGGRVVALVDGTASMMDLIEAAVDVTGPVELDLATWTMGLADVRSLAVLMEDGDITSVRIVVDRSFESFRSYYSALIDVVGAENIRQPRSHAKFAILRNESWSITIRASMNANRNLRWEQVDIDDCVEISSFFTAHMDSVFRLEA